MLLSLTNNFLETDLALRAQKIYTQHAAIWLTDEKSCKAISKFCSQIQNTNMLSVLNSNSITIGYSLALSLIEEFTLANSKYSNIILNTKEISLEHDHTIEVPEFPNDILDALTNSVRGMNINHSYLIVRVLELFLIYKLKLLKSHINTLGETNNTQYKLLLPHIDISSRKTQLSATLKKEVDQRNRSYIDLNLCPNQSIPQNHIYFITIQYYTYINSIINTLLAVNEALNSKEDGFINFFDLNITKAIELLKNFNFEIGEIEAQILNIDKDSINDPDISKNYHEILVQFLYKDLQCKPLVW